MNIPPEVVTAAWWLLAIASVLGSALCSGVEMGCYSLNRIRLDLRVLRSPPDRAARLLQREIDNPARLISTILVGNNVFHYFGALATTALLDRSGASHAAVVVVNVLVLTPILLIFGESVPKELFRLDADRLTYSFARPLAFLRAIFTLMGVLPLIMFIARGVERLSGLAAGEESAVEHMGDARKRIATLLKESASSGTLSESQTTLVDRALAMRETKVRDEMIPWSNVRKVRLSWGRDRIVRYLAGQSSSRVPVLDDSGRVLGVLRQIDALTRPEQSIESLLVPPARLAPDTPLLQAISVLAQSVSRLGIVESGGNPVGLATNKDLVEPLTGELPDW